MASQVSRRLRTYRKKRDFTQTAEPRGAEPTPSRRAPSFMVHKHHATRLHYDLRLEMDGVLASWAIPKGPSYDPGTKRLAVETEDHPLEYGSFEGRIPDEAYGGGDSLIWERGTYDTDPPGQASAQRKKGHLRLQLWGKKLRGTWHLVRTRGGGEKSQWLFFKAKDEKADPHYDVVQEHPESVVSGRKLTRRPTKRSRRSTLLPASLLQKVWPPMLAKLSQAERATEGSYAFEVKYDGFRALAALVNGHLDFRSRNNLDFRQRFPQLAQALEKIPVNEAVLDGEVVALDSQGVSRFQLLQQGRPTEFRVFDLLWLDGEDLRQLPLEDRRELLESLLAEAPEGVKLAERVGGNLPTALRSARAHGWEGLIAKASGSLYRGVRSSDWLKIKLHQSQEVVVVGFTASTTGQPEIGALLVGVKEGKGFRYVGRLGTGFSQKQRRQLFTELSAEAAERPPVSNPPRSKEARWVRPHRVAQAAFSEWTSDGLLRQPSFLGFREDKEAGQTQRELPLPSSKGQRSGGRRGVAAREEVTLTHPDKVLYPKDGFTKADLYAYFRDLSSYLVPALNGRPLALQLWPEGISKPGFFRQSVASTAYPEWATSVKVRAEGRTLEHAVVDRPETLLWLANRSALTLHMWSASLPHLDQPDWVVFDLDPGDGPFSDLVEVAQVLRGMLEHLELVSVPKTSGQRGLHVLVPLGPGHTHAQAVRFAVQVTQTLESGLPQLATTQRSKVKRKGRLYLDAFQNGKGKTLVSPYSLRAKDGAPISTPLQWSEVGKRLDPSRFNLKTLRARLDRQGDLFSPALESQQRLPSSP